MAIASITPTRLHEIAQNTPGVELIDVRTPAEFRELHVPFARNVPLDRLQPGSPHLQPRSGQPLYVICRSGSRATAACQKLLAAGYANVVNVEGGTQAWDEAGLPVVRGQRTISLERQVRIAAGSLVLTGALLGYFAHPAWIGLAALVGAGLVFSGITDTCGMGLLLARMPWNTIRNSKPDNSQSPEACCG
jgi:rhodanese-related sulfurtransferase